MIYKGALKPTVDKRDYKVAAAGNQYPDAWQLDYLPRVKNQRQVNSCVAHALSSILEYFNYKELGTTEKLSTDFIYGMQGIAYGREEQGMYLRDACKISKDYGDCLNTTINTNTEQPQCTIWLQKHLTDEIYNEASVFRTHSYARCNSDAAIKHALMNYGPVLASIKWYDKYSMKDSVITMDTTSSYGRHAIMVYGWNEKGWLCQNSWGWVWGDEGRFIYPGEFAEAWSFVDAENSDIITPRRGKFIDIIYKLINKIINFFKKER